MNLSDPIITSSQSPDREQKNGSFSLIERVILSAGAMLIFSGGRRCAAGGGDELADARCRLAFLSDFEGEACAFGSAGDLVLFGYSC